MGGCARWAGALQGFHLNLQAYRGEFIDPAEFNRASVALADQQLRDLLCQVTFD